MKFRWLQTVEKVKFRSSLFKGWWGCGGKAPASELFCIRISYFRFVLEIKLWKQQSGIRPPNGAEPRAGQSGNIKNLFLQSDLPLKGKALSEFLPGVHNKKGNQPVPLTCCETETVFVLFFVNGGCCPASKPISAKPNDGIYRQRIGTGRVRPVFAVRQNCGHALRLQRADLRKREMIRHPNRFRRSRMTAGLFGRQGLDG